MYQDQTKRISAGFMKVRMSPQKLRLRTRPTTLAAPGSADDSEFTTPGNQGEMNRIDLLTVLEHELGHVLGYEHADSGAMQNSLAPGVREVL